MILWCPMQRSRLELREDRSIGLAYIIGPAAGLLTLWLWLVAFDFLGPAFSFGRDLLVLPWLLTYGGLLCLLAELLIVTPMLIGFRRYRWSWLNGWTACALGFLLGALGPFAILSVQISSGNQLHESWNRAFGISAACGSVGLVIALTFRLLAVRTVSIQSGSGSQR